MYRGKVDLEKIAEKKIEERLKIMSLQEEIAKKSSEIYREAYQMSIGELINLYRDEELDIHPEFQRVFRWSDYQKTKLIESIMLNIPIPQIFVSQREDGTWDVIDGVQRLSTIFQFVGILKDEEGKNIQPLILEATDDLPSFAGMKWQGDGELSFTKEQQLTLKRARLDVIIIKKESDTNTKYELFQRLNTGGSLLSDQEVRSCLVIMSNRNIYELIDKLSKNASYEKCLKISARKSGEQYDQEMIVRLLVADHIDWNIISKYKDFSELLDKEILSICDDASYNITDITERFENTFDLLAGLFGEDVFRKYEGEKYTGPFLASAFQTIAFGVLSNVEKILEFDDKNDWLKEKVKAIYSQETYIKNTIPGVRAIPRYKELSIWGREYFKR